MSINSTNCGILLTRAQPFHRGHMNVIKKMLMENEKVLVVIGSADKFDTERNSFTITERLVMAEKMMTLPEFRYYNRRVEFVPLNDWSPEESIPYESEVSRSQAVFGDVNSEWGTYFYYNVVNKIGNKAFTLYYNDNKEIVDAWFPEYIKNRIHVVQEPRDKQYSSSHLRKAWMTGDFDYVYRAAPYLDMGLEEMKNIQNKLLNCFYKERENRNYEK